MEFYHNKVTQNLATIIHDIPHTEMSQIISTNPVKTSLAHRSCCQSHRHGNNDINARGKSSFITTILSPHTQQVTITSTNLVPKVPSTSPQMTHLDKL